MANDRRKLAVAGLLSAVLLGWLVWTADFALPAVSVIDWVALAGLGGAIVLILVGRGLSFQATAPLHLRDGSWRWLRLAARHQAVFSVFPGGFGDLGFPYLAHRIAGIEAPVAVRIIAQVRLRDMVFVALLGLGGLASVGRSADYAPLAGVIAVILLWFVEDLARLALRLIGFVMPKSRWTALFADASENRATTSWERLWRTALTALVWSGTLAAVIAGFAVIGIPINLGQAMLIVAAVNLAGAIAFSIAGLGVSEVGAAAALVLSGFAPERAAGIALVVRPLLLVAIVLVSVALDLALGQVKSRRK